MYSRIVVDGPYLVRRPWEANGPEACAGASIGVLLNLAEANPGARGSVVWEGPPGPFEGGGRSGRQEIDPGYKAQRRPWDPSLVALVDELRQVYRWLGWDDVWCEDEADDAAAGLTAREVGRSLLWSADKDWLQLVSAIVDVQREFNSSAEPITDATILERTKLTPEGWSDYLALRGDPVDGVIGVPKVGDDRARKLLAAVPDLVDRVLAGEDRNAAMAAAAQRDASMVRWVDWVFESAGLLRVSRELTRLRSDSPLTIRPAELDDFLAMQWLEAHDLGGLARRLAQQRTRIPEVFVPDAWEDLPF